MRNPHLGGGSNTQESQILGSSWLPMYRCGMRVVHRLVAAEALNASELQSLLDVAPQLVLVFAPVAEFEGGTMEKRLAELFPSATRLGCSTAGEVGPTGVSEGLISLTAIHFDQATFRVAEASLFDMSDSRAAGERLATQLPSDGLRDVFVLAPGVGINGSALIEGIAQIVGPAVPISGGLAADQGRFEKTFVQGPSATASNHIVALGFYGARLRVRHGSFGGWQPFGPARRVTRAEGNILFELDGERALDVYRRYLGEHAAGLPGTGLLFPLSVLGGDHKATGLVRTILGIDDAKGALILAGDVESGGYVQLMHASKDALIDGATRAAENVLHGEARVDGPSLAILISCVGRKLVMGARVDEEVEAVGEVFGPGCVLTGFYSNGEISPFDTRVECKLHNQTMTITLIDEMPR